MPANVIARPFVRVERAASILGVVCVFAAIVIIWVARASLTRDVYVSEMGAPGMPTARWFQVSLVLVVIGDALIAYVGRGLRSTLRLWTPAISLWIASGFFLIASQVTCTMGCPLPYGASFNWQDFTHTLMAVLAFAAACWAMLQTGFAHSNRGLALISRACAVAVAVIAGTGGIFSLLRFNLDFGSRLELLATTVALAWLAVLGIVLALQLARTITAVDVLVAEIEETIVLGAATATSAAADADGPARG